MRRCPECLSPRPDVICWKCGSETFVPCDGWDEPALPPVDKIRSIAKQVGYAIAVHGSQERDLDIIATPWVETAIDNCELMVYLAEELNGRILEIEKKPVGRYACTIQIDGYFKPIDLSVAPMVKTS